VSIIAAVVVIIVVVAVAGVYVLTLGNKSTIDTSPVTVTKNRISVSGLSLCPTNCVYPAPYVSALVTINASVPISTLVVYVNNTYDTLAFQNPATTTIACSTAPGQTCSVNLGGSAYSSGTVTSSTAQYATCVVPANSTSCSATYTGSANTLTKFAYEWKGSVPNNLIPVVQGDTYVFSFVATFQDGSTATATASAVVSNTSSDSRGEHNVTFIQVGVGACPFLGEPWAVTVGNTTKVQPAGTTLPLDDGGPLFGTYDTNISTISFSLPPGIYQYQIHPSFNFFAPNSGTLNVNATSNIVMQIAYGGHGCVTTTSK
jgi:hypothetical protein